MVENGWLLVMMAMSLATMELDPNKLIDKNDGYQCIVVQSMDFVSLTIPSVLLCARVTYVYVHLMDSENINELGLMYLCRLFWKNRGFKRNQAIIIIIILCVLGIGNALIYYSYNGGIIESQWPNCGNIFRSIIVLPIIQVITGCMLLVFSIQFVRYQVLDQIKMSLELICFTISIWLCNITFAILQTVKKTDLINLNSWNIFAQGIIAMFFGLYFPLFVVILHRNHRNNTDYSKIQLSDPRILASCRSFYCEENGLFVLDYIKYKEGLCPIEQLIARYIDFNSPYELNINYDLRVRVLNSDSSTRDMCLEQVYKEICDLLTTNVLPYIDAGITGFQ